MRYVRITQVDGKRFILKVTSDSAKAISGYEVDKEGEEIVPTGFDNRLRIVEHGAIRKLTELQMNNTYGTLEPKR